LDKAYVKELADSNSQQFKDLASAVTTELVKVICTGDFATGCSVTVTGFRQGSTIVDVTATVNGKEADVRPHLKTALDKLPDTIDGAKVTDKKTPTDFDKCTDTKRCNVDEGDCDKDSNCMKGLICGMNNCPAKLNLDPLADCCYDPKAVASAACDASNPNMWSCCKDRKCKVDEGDCDSDDECEKGLVCARNSCGFTGLDTKRFFPAGQADCCKTKSRALFYGIPTWEDLNEENLRNEDEPGFLYK